MHKKSIIMFANSFDNRKGSNFGISGGDEILINYVKALIKKKFNVRIITWEKGKNILTRFNIEDKYITSYKSFFFHKFGFVIFYIYRIIAGIFLALKIEINSKELRNHIVFSSSDFMTDLLPALILSLRKKIKMINAIYLIAPSPFSSRSPYKGIAKIKSFFYWFLQKISIKLIKEYSNGILVCSELAIKYLKDETLKTDNFLIIHGGIDIDNLENTKKKLMNVDKIYDVCFFARLHPQKGPIEMIYIWNEVLKDNKNKKLVIIGDGPEKTKIKKIIKDLKLE